MASTFKLHTMLPLINRSCCPRCPVLSPVSSGKPVLWLVSKKPTTSSCLPFWTTATLNWHHHHERRQFTLSHCPLECGKRESISPQHALPATTSHDHEVSTEHTPSVIVVSCCYYASISLVKHCQSQTTKSYHVFVPLFLFTYLNQPTHIMISVSASTDVNPLQLSSARSATDWHCPLSGRISASLSTSVIGLGTGD